jgi:hypothetical protein
VIFYLFLFLLPIFPAKSKPASIIKITIRLRKQLLELKNISEGENGMRKHYIRCLAVLSMIVGVFQFGVAVIPEAASAV